MSKKSKKEETKEMNLYPIKELEPLGGFPEINDPVYILDLPKVYRMIHKVFEGKDTYETSGKNTLRDIIQNPEKYVKEAIDVLLVTSIETFPYYDDKSCFVGIGKINIKGIPLEYAIERNQDGLFCINIFMKEYVYLKEINGLVNYTLEKSKYICNNFKMAMEKFSWYIVSFSQLLSASYFSKKELYFVGISDDDCGGSSKRLVKGLIDLSPIDDASEESIPRIVVSCSTGNVRFFANNNFKGFTKKKDAEEYFKYLKNKK